MGRVPGIRAISLERLFEGIKTWTGELSPLFKMMCYVVKYLLRWPVATLDSI